MEKEIAIVKAYDNAQDMIKFADSKANLSIVIQSLLVTIGLGTTLISDSFNVLWGFNRNYFWIYFTFTVFFAICSMTGIVLSILVYKARFSPEEKEEERKGIIYHRHIADYKNSIKFQERIEELKPEEIKDDFIKQTYNVAEIANKKMKFVNTSVWFLFVNIILTVILMIISGFVLIIG